MYYTSFDTLIDSFFPLGHRPTRDRVFVVSDTDYKKYQQEQAEREILVLESKLNRYNTAVEEIKVEIEKTREAAGLLPPGTDDKVGTTT